MSAAYEADNNSAIAYQFSGTDASTPGYAEGTITFTPADKGKYNLYWADDEKALYGYYEIDRIQFKIKEESRCKISDMLRQLVAVMESGDEYKLLKVNAVFMNIYHLLLTECAVEKKNLLPINMPDNFAYAKTIIEYIGCNYTENINLKDMADLVGLMSSYFSKYFKNITGTNFTQYLNSVRLEHALNEMLFKGQTVTKAAMNNGFPNVKSFIEICKKIYGCTPMEYKKQKIAEK